VYLLSRATSNATGIDSYYFVIRSGASWTVVDSSADTPRWGFSDLWISPAGTLYSAGGGVYRWGQQQWHEIFSFSTNNEGGKLFGSSDDNIFVATFDSGVFHHNGTDWQRLTALDNPSLGFMGGWTDGSTVFIIAYTLGGFPNKTLVFRGQ
jgi:hypothetical protein